MSGTDIMLCSKIDKPLVIYIYTVVALCNDVHDDVVIKIHNFVIILVSYDRQNLTFMLLYY